MAWGQSRAEAQKLAEAGFAGMDGPCPQLDPLATRAMHCWNFCGGWQPANWPVYAALYEVDDWHQLIDVMTELKGLL